jgi:DNA polymerase
MPVSRDQELRSILAFFQQAGVDALLCEEPVDRMAADLPPATSTNAPSGNEGNEHSARSVPRKSDEVVKAGRNLAPAISPEAATMAAREAAKTAQSLDELRGMLESFEGCALRATATRLAFADGNPQARVMFVGEAPGREEDLAGLPFVGRSGKLLDRMMASIGIDRSSAYIANIIPWRPPGNRTPTPQESAICLPFVRRQIELADPDVLVCLGGPSAQTLLKQKEGILKTRGRWFPYQTGSREIRALATLHPAYLLRQPVQKRLAWRDFLAIKRALGVSQSGK